MPYPVYSTGEEVLASELNRGLCPIGCMLPFSGRTAPTNWLLGDGTAVSRATYSDLFGVIVPSIGTFTVTLATPAVFTLNSHGFVSGDQVYFTTTGALPTGLSANTIYYVIATGLTTNAFEVSATRGGAAINTSVSQSGVHTCHYCPYGLGDGSTTFNLPDTRQRVFVGYKSADTYNGYIGQTGGEQTHVLTVAESASHTHTTGGLGNSQATSNSSFAWGNSSNAGTITSSSSGGDGAHNNMQPYITGIYIIRY